MGFWGFWGFFGFFLRMWVGVLTASPDPPPRVARSCSTVADHLAGPAARHRLAAHWAVEW